MASDTQMSLLEEDALALTQAALRISKAMEEKDEEALAQALDSNLELWVGIRTLVSRPDNQLPPEIKDNLTRLSQFVSQKTMEMRNGIKTESLEALVNTNLQISEGLLEGMGNAGG